MTAPSEFQLIKELNRLEDAFQASGKGPLFASHAERMSSAAWELWSVSLNAAHMAKAIKHSEVAVKYEENKNTAELWFRLARLYTAACRYMEAINVCTAFAMDYVQHAAVNIAYCTAGSACRRIAVLAGAQEYFQRLADAADCTPFNRSTVVMQLAWSFEIESSLLGSDNNLSNSEQLWQLAFALSTEEEAERLQRNEQLKSRGTAAGVRRLFASTAVSATDVDQWQQWRNDPAVWRAAADSFFKYESYLTAVRL